jgi:phytoene dehydrogenase-like protein
MARLGEALGVTWPVEPAEIAMQVQLPDGQTVMRWADPQRWEAERLATFGPQAERFWQWQEAAADRLWEVALRGVPWPPQGLDEVLRLGQEGVRMAMTGPLQLPQLGLDAFRPVAAQLGGAPLSLRQYVDGQLLISAQATSAGANALYGAAALDMPRRGVAHVRGGIGKLAETLVGAIRSHGGEVLYRQRVTSVERTDAGYRVFSKREVGFAADHVIFNLAPWDATRLMAGDAPESLRRAQRPPDGWGAFMAYVGLDGAIVHEGAALHHQVLVREPLGEGNSVFLSLSLADDVTRAPAAHRTLTISTHTDLRPWWELFERDRPAYEARETDYTERVLAAAETALPGLRKATRLVLPGTPVTFQRYTSRSRGWVGGFPQTSLFRARAPRVGPGLWLVGDSIFPGQSVLATALGGARVATSVMATLAMDGSWSRAAVFQPWSTRHPSTPRLPAGRGSAQDASCSKVETAQTRAHLSSRIGREASWYNNAEFHKGGAR